MSDTSQIAAALAALPHASGRVAPPRVAADGTASVILDVSGLGAAERETLEADVRRVLGAVEGISSVRVVQTAQKPERRLIAVGSGKGGVGKSTLAANLAIAMKRLGFRTGLVDADIYGPSQPRLMQATDERPTAEGKVLNPIETRWGVPMLSMGQLVAADKALAWRGPMVSGALGQLVDAAWGETDTLIVDLPPGTGDIQLSMIQKHRPAGAVIVSTPQDLALIDAARARSTCSTPRASRSWGWSRIWRAMSVRTAARSPIRSAMAARRRRRRGSVSPSWAASRSISRSAWRRTQASRRRRATMRRPSRSSRSLRRSRRR